MPPLLFDEGLPRIVAQALTLVGWEVHAVGDAGAPPRGSPDDVNCQWCAARSAVLVTYDRGMKDRTILDSISQHHAHAVFVGNDLRSGPTRALLRALLNSEAAMDAEAAKSHGLLRHRLRPRGGLDKR